MNSQLNEMKELKKQADNVLESLKALKKGIRNFNSDIQLQISMHFLDEDLDMAQQLVERVGRNLECNCLAIYIKGEKQ